MTGLQPAGAPVCSRPAGPLRCCTTAPCCIRCQVPPSATRRPPSGKEARRRPPPAASAALLLARGCCLRKGGRCQCGLSSGLFSGSKGGRHAPGAAAAARCRGLLNREMAAPRRRRPSPSPRRADRVTVCGSNSFHIQENRSTFSGPTKKIVSRALACCPSPEASR